ncbi:MAG: DNA repair protein RecN [Brevinema sp.]
MLERISIKNYAVIDNLDINFKDGFSVFTGETGAGKSVLIGALGLLLGSRSDFSMIRSGEERMIVEGEFTIKTPELKEFLTGLNISETDTLIIKREIHQNGKSRVFINSSQETLALLEQIGVRLADMHGQHDHQLLLNKNIHGDILDSFASLENEVNIFDSLYHKTLAKKEEKELLETNAQSLKQEKSFYLNAHQEISNAKIQPQEFEELELELSRMQNHEKIFSALKKAHEGIYKSEINATQILEDAQKSLSMISSYAPKYAEVSQMMDDALVQTRETAHLLSSYLEEMDFDPADMDMVLDRMALIKELQRKYQKNSIEELLTFGSQCEALLDKVDNLDEELSRLSQEYETLIVQLRDNALALSKLRQQAAIEFSKKIEDELSFLQMSSVFEVKISYAKKEDSFLTINGTPLLVSAKGIDRIEFMISPNIGEEPKPLAKIASGGEISRIMLSLKAVLAANDPVETGIFDEIDAGIGGMTAHNVAIKMQEIAKLRQIFCITHLAQIASKADHHYHVKKESDGSRTFTTITYLSHEERVKEIARMLGGEGEHSELLAKEMLSQQQIK